jgi:WD40 repeat protein
MNDFPALDKPKRKGILRPHRRVYLIGVLACFSFILAGVVYLNTANKPKRLFTKPTEPITAENVDKLEFLGQLDVPYFPKNVQFSSDSRTMLFTVGNGVSIWDLEAGNLKRNIVSFRTCSNKQGTPEACYNEDRSYPYDAKLSPDGKWVNTGVLYAEYGGIKLWNVDTGELVKHFPLHFKSGALMEFIPDSNLVLYQGYIFTDTGFEPELHVWDISQQQEYPMEIPPVTNYSIGGIQEIVERNIRFLPFSRDFVYLNHNSLYRYTFDSNQASKLIELSDKPLQFALRPDGKQVAIPIKKSEYLHAIEIWDLESQQKITQWDMKVYQIYDMQYTSDGRNIVVFSYESVALMDSETGQLVNEIIEGSGDIPRFIRIAVSADDKLVATVTRNDFLIWELKTGKLRQRLTMPEDTQKQLAFSPDGTMLVSNTGMMWGIPTD